MESDNDSEARTRTRASRGRDGMVEPEEEVEPMKGIEHVEEALDL